MKSIRFCEYAIKVNLYSTCFNSKGAFDITYHYNEKENFLHIVCEGMFSKCGILIHNFGSFISKFVIPKELLGHHKDVDCSIYTSNDGFHFSLNHIRDLDVLLNILYKFYSKNKHILIKKPYEMAISVKNLQKPEEIISKIVLDIL